MGAFLSGAATLFFASVTALLVYETWALATKHKPITAYVRDQERLRPFWAPLLGVLIGMLVGHFGWR